MNRKCSICGDLVKRLGFHLGGQPTCSSCRVFFHRNATRYEELKCKNSDLCEVNTKLSRKKCAKCRLKRCFAIGMQSKIAKSVPIEKPKNSQSNSSSSSPEVAFSNCSFDQRLRNLLSESESFTNEIPHSNETIEDYFKVSKRKTRSKFNLTTFERSQIDLINQFTADSFEEESTLELESSIPTESTLYISQTSTVYAKRIVKFCKKFDFFRSLSPEEQLKLTKSFSRRVIPLRVVFQFLPELRASKMLANETGSHSILVARFPNRNPKSREAIRFQNKMMRGYSLLQQDTTIRNLLSVCFLTSPFDEKVEEFPLQLRFKYYFFSHLMLRYLQAKYRKLSQARNTYQDLIKLFNSNERKFHARMRKQLVAFGLDKLSEFPIEILNLKS